MSVLATSVHVNYLTRLESITLPSILGHYSISSLNCRSYLDLFPAYPYFRPRPGILDLTSTLLHSVTKPYEYIILPLLPTPTFAMPIRNPFVRRPGSVVIQDENHRPEDRPQAPGFERVDTVGSKASSVLSIRTTKNRDNGEYKMSGKSLGSGTTRPHDHGVWPLAPPPVMRYCRIMATNTKISRQ